MGSSAKKKKEKQKDFQKPKFKVGKTKPKASNFTDTSFKSKGSRDLRAPPPPLEVDVDPTLAIVMGQQSLSTTAPNAVEQFKHNLSLASSAKGDKQRQEALSYLTTQLSSDPPVNPVGTETILARLLPLISDSSTPVRNQLLKFFRELPDEQVRHSVEPTIMFIRAGMTHLSADVDNDALGFMDWLLDVAGDDLVACPGGWVKTLNTFCAMLGWSISTKKDGWSSGSRSGGARGKTSLNQARAIDCLTKFLRIGFEPDESVLPSPDEGRWDYLYKAPINPNASSYLNLFGVRRAEDGAMYADRESRQQIFHKRFLNPISNAVESTKKEGGTAGRAAAGLDQLLRSPDGIGGFEPSDALDQQDLFHLW